MPKKDTVTPTPTPAGEPTGPKTLSIELPGDTSNKLRKLAAKTGITQARLRAQLSRSAEVEGAITKALHQIYVDWKNDLGDDLFGPIKAEAPDVNG